MMVTRLKLSELPAKFGFNEAMPAVLTKKAPSFDNWSMQDDDAPVLRYLFRNLKPKRHLEFGTWQGLGTLCCLEECQATVFTINLPFGEREASGEKIYGNYRHELEDVRRWARKVGLAVPDDPQRNDFRTDSLGFIGRHYLEKGFGHRVCQVYCDSREWDIANYPPGFFDTCLIDGAHDRETVIADTNKALRLVRKDGVILWHDYCPSLVDRSRVVRGVTAALEAMNVELSERCELLRWLYPSMVLLGVGRSEGGGT